MQRNSNTHTNTFSEPNRDSHSYSDGDAYGHTYRDGETYTNPEDRSHAKISAHARAAPMTRRIKTVVVEDLVVTRDTNWKAWPSLRVRCSTNSHEMSSRLAHAYEIRDNSCNSCLEQAAQAGVV